MNTTIESRCGCDARTLQSHLGAVHILQAVVGGVVEYLYDKGDTDGAWLASALLNANRLIRNTLPDHALDEQHLAAAFAVVRDAARHASETWGADTMADPADAEATEPGYETAPGKEKPQ
ncbi:MAG TPA: hypothetical protein VHI13_13650 [Candidatus Kapabacteria bacterium]|nr:hypothetical protein [Candidatus Kapabacteria bacterium]